MTTKRYATALALVTAGSLVLSGCGSDDNSVRWTLDGADVAPIPTASVPVDCGGTQALSAEGSTAQKGAMDVFVAAYTQQCPGQQLSYTASGSGAGVKQFISGIVDFGGSDSPLKDSEARDAVDRCDGAPAWNLPMVFGPVAVVYRLDGVGELVLSGELLARIFSGAITRWNDPAIAALNAGAALPELPITVVYRADESGTTDNFQKYLGAASGGVWDRGAGKTFLGGVGQGGQGSPGVADAVALGQGAIGYVEWSFAQDKGLGMALIDSGSGPVELSPESARTAIGAAEIKGQGNDLVIDLEALYASDAPGAYPLVLVTYEIVCSKGYDPQTAQAVKAFLTTAATAGQAGMTGSGYVPLPESFQQRLLTAIAAIA
ncbi:phosphate ABC transporter substrate-binding protein PstS [Actinokineospora guangxiensis]|uniref:Phosphate-binding protein n=1 Tax=Actinokineospora guangxiensis TaxID=1490288 RepID=A0ABW0EI16_9PSEU